MIKEWKVSYRPLDRVEEYEILLEDGRMLIAHVPADLANWFRAGLRVIDLITEALKEGRAEIPNVGVNIELVKEVK